MRIVWKHWLNKLMLVVKASIGHKHKQPHLRARLFLRHFCSRYTEGAKPQEAAQVSSRGAHWGGGGAQRRRTRGSEGRGVSGGSSSTGSKSAVGECEGTLSTKSEAGYGSAGLPVWSSDETLRVTESWWLKQSRGEAWTVRDVRNGHQYIRWAVSLDQFQDGVKRAEQ